MFWQLFLACVYYMQFFQFWNHSVRSQKWCNTIFIYNCVKMHHRVLLTKKIVPWTSKVNIKFCYECWPKFWVAVTLANLRFAAVFWVFNRNFSIGWKLQRFAISTLKTQPNAVNACVKRSLQCSFTIREWDIVVQPKYMK